MLEHATAAECAPEVGDHPLEEGPVLGRHVGSRLVLGVVGPWAADHPVAQPLTAQAETSSGPSSGPVMYPSTDVAMARYDLAPRLLAGSDELCRAGRVRAPTGTGASSALA